MRAGWDSVNSLPALFGGGRGVVARGACQYIEPFNAWAEEFSCFLDPFSLFSYLSELFADLRKLLADL
jgi:hypothetical protein